MPTLYIANTSKHHHHFVYRSIDMNAVRNQDIPIGAQIVVGGGHLAMDEINHIVKQHERYGLTHVKELSRRKDYTGLCYNIDQPINLDYFGETLEQNDTAMTERATERREETVTAIASNLQAQMRDRGMTVPRTEVELIEETNGTPKIAAGYEVTQEGIEPRHNGKRSRRGR